MSLATTVKLVLEAKHSRSLDLITANAVLNRVYSKALAEGVAINQADRMMGGQLIELII